MNLLDQSRVLYPRKKELLNLKPGLLVLFFVPAGILATGQSAKAVSELLDKPITGTQDIEGEENYIILEPDEAFRLGKMLKILPVGLAVLDTRNEQFKPHDN